MSIRQSILAAARNSVTQQLYELSYNGSTPIYRSTDRPKIFGRNRKARYTATRKHPHRIAEFLPILSYPIYLRLIHGSAIEEIDRRAWCSKGHVDNTENLCKQQYEMPVTNIKNCLEFHCPLLEWFVMLQDQIEIAVTGTDLEISQSDVEITLQTSSLI